MISEYFIQWASSTKGVEFWSQTPDVMPGGPGNIENDPTDCPPTSVLLVLKLKEPLAKLQRKGEQIRRILFEEGAGLQ
jgi:hypothetical protein